MNSNNNNKNSVLSLFSGRKKFLYSAFALSFLLLTFGSIIAGAASNLNLITPLSSDTTNCYLVNNFTTNNTIKFALNGISVNMTVNSISPNSTLLDVYNFQYNMSPGQLQIFLNQSGYIYAVDMGRIESSATPPVINVDLCATQTTPLTPTVPTTTSSLNTTTVAPAPTSTVKLPLTLRKTLGEILIVAAVVLAIAYVHFNRRRRGKTAKSS